MTKYHSPTPAELRALRAKLEYTQAEMADFLMCSLNAYTKWEQGVNKMVPMIWNAMQIIVGQAEADSRAKTKPKDNGNSTPMTGEDKAFMESLLEGWVAPSEYE